MWQCDDTVIGERRGRQATPSSWPQRRDTFSFMDCYTVHMHRLHTNTHADGSGSVDLLLLAGRGKNVRPARVSQRDRGSSRTAGRDREICFLAPFRVSLVGYFRRAKLELHQPKSHSIPCLHGRVSRARAWGGGQLRNAGDHTGTLHTPLYNAPIPAISSSKIAIIRALFPCVMIQIPTPLLLFPNPQRL